MTLKIKTKVIFSFFVFITLLFPNILNASIEAQINGSGVRIRNVSNTDSDNSIITSVNTGYKIILTSTNKYSGAGCSEGWYQINYKSSLAYVCSSYVSFYTNPGYDTSDWSSRVDEPFVSAWKDTNKSARNDSLIVGTNLTVLETYGANSGCPNQWYKVRYHNNKTGYVCSTYVSTKNKITANDENYYNTLLSQGFPESYLPYLTYLHNKYPNWIFKAVNTGLNWNDVMNGESGKNYIQTNIDAYRQSTVIAEPSDWYYASNGVIAFYMDPRNFLNEKFIFMFEKLNYDYDNDSQYYNVLKSLFGTSYLSSDTYISYFLNGGKTHGVNPIHLGSRSIQEGARDPNYSAVSGKSTSTYNGVSLYGYYNFYNIGSYKDSVTSSPVTRGLAYAAGVFGTTDYSLPWNTPAKAIAGGADVIGRNYISKGQYTMYFQKFNTSPTSAYAKYTHQYMTNVQAVSSEAFTVFESYLSSGIINNSYEFSIPVYNNMPESISLPSIGNTNNRLSNLTVNGKKISGFDPDVIDYTYYVNKTENSVQISATTESSTSQISGIGQITLNETSTNASVVVISENGATKTYNIELIRVDELTNIEDIVKNLSVNVKNDYFSGISTNTSISTIINNIYSKSPNSIVTVKNSSGNTITSGQFKTGDTVTINSTSNEKKTFKVAVTGDVNGDGLITILDLLRVQKHLLGASTLSDSYRVAADTNNDGAVTILDLLRVQKHILKELNL